MTGLSRVSAELASHRTAQVEVKRPGRLHPHACSTPDVLVAMPSFDNSPPDLVRRFDANARLLPEARRRQMFGYPTCVVNGNLFMGLHQDRLFLRLGETDRASRSSRASAPRSLSPCPVA